MTIYISQGRYTPAAIKGMSAKPEDRSEAVAELFAARSLLPGAIFGAPSLHRKIPLLTRIPETGSMTGWWVASLCPSYSTTHTL